PDPQQSTRVVSLAEINALKKESAGDDLDPTQWFVLIKGQQEGPMNNRDVHNLLAQGRISEKTYIWCERMDNWQRLNEVPEFTNALSITSEKHRDPVLRASAAAAAGQAGRSGDEVGANTVAMTAEQLQAE